MSTVHKLFTEIFRPQSIDQAVLIPRIYNEVSQGLKQNIMFFGRPGSGKSTLTRILSKGYDTLTINASAERGIDVIREKITNFASAISLMDGAEKVKVIVLEECDGLTSDSFDALRAVIERYADSVRFIGNCNNINKIPAPIQSRFKCIPIDPLNQEEEQMLFDGYVNYVGQVLTHIKCAYTDEVLREFVKANFPDMRSIMNQIQSIHISGAKELDKNSLIKSFDCSDLFEQIVNNNDPIENYKLITSNYAGNVDATMESISKSFIDFIRINYSIYNSKIPMCVIAIAEHNNMLPNAIDKVIVLLSLVYKLQIIIKG